ATGHKRNAPTDLGAGRVHGLDEETYVLRVLALAVVDVTADSSGTVWSLIGRPVDREVLLLAVHQRSRRGLRRRSHEDAEMDLLPPPRLNKPPKRGYLPPTR